MLLRRSSFTEKQFFLGLQWYCLRNSHLTNINILAALNYLTVQVSNTSAPPMILLYASNSQKVLFHTAWWKKELVGLTPLFECSMIWNWGMKLLAVSLLDALIFIWNECFYFQIVIRSFSFQSCTIPVKTHSMSPAICTVYYTVLAKLLYSIIVGWWMLISVLPSQKLSGFLLNIRINLLYLQMRYHQSCKCKNGGLQNIYLCVFLFNFLVLHIFFCFICSWSFLEDGKKRCLRKRRFYYFIDMGKLQMPCTVHYRIARASKKEQSLPFPARKRTVAPSTSAWQSKFAVHVKCNQ